MLHLKGTEESFYKRMLPKSGTGFSHHLQIGILIFSVWVIFIFYLAFQPFEDQDLSPVIESLISEEALQKSLPKVEFLYAGSRITYREPYKMVHFLLRKSGHLFIYAVLAFLVVYLQLMWGINAVKAFSRAILILCLVAIADEFIQFFNEDRSGLVEDVVLNIFSGVFVLFWLAYRERNKVF